MGTRLRNMKSSMKGRKLEDGKTIGGKGRLSDPQILQMQQYYGNAIRGNKGDLQKMHKETWAVWWHKASTDEAPYHGMCNINWCRYKQAEMEQRKHSNNLPMAVMNVIKPIFKDLTHPDLLRRCLDGHTQNANESVNSVIWKYCPKTKLYGLQTVETAVGLAVCIFNDGAGRIKDILHMMDITAGSFTCRFIEDKDSLRILTAERQTAMASKEFRRAQRMRRMGREEELAQVEGNPYQRGGY